MSAALNVLGLCMLSVSLLFGLALPVQAAETPKSGDGIQVMEAFERQPGQVRDSNVLADQKKHVIMFFMGVPLLILLLITAALGVAMVVYGKQAYMLHMIFAGLTVTLAIAHLVTGLVWFYPF